MINDNENEAGKEKKDHRVRAIVHLQPFAGCLRLALVFVWNSALREKFFKSFSLVLTKFSFWQGEEVLSHSATRKVTRIYHVIKVIIVHRFTCGERRIW